MILYRTQVFLGKDWCTVWDPTEAKGLDTLETFDGEHEARLDKVKIPLDVEALVFALNMADANHMNFDGELVARTELSQGTT